MQVPCLTAPIDSSHWDACARDVMVIAGDLIPRVATGQATIDELRRAVFGMHECHVLALVLQLSFELGNRNLTPADIRQSAIENELGGGALWPAI